MVLLSLLSPVALGKEGNELLWIKENTYARYGSSGVFKEVLRESAEEKAD